MANEQLEKKLKGIKNKVTRIDIMKCAAAGISSDTTIRKYLTGDVPDTKATQANDVYIFLSRLIQQRKKQVA